jgi:cytochrome c oxidase subunit IV
MNPFSFFSTVSSHALKIDEFFFALTALSLAIAGTVFLLVAVFCARYRQGSPHSGALVMTRAVRDVWVGPAAIWLGLLLLLATTVGAAYAPLGAFGMAANLLIAGLCVGLIAILFMGLARSSVLVRLASGAGILWLLFLFLLSAGDYLSR